MMSLDEVPLSSNVEKEKETKEDDDELQTSLMEALMILSNASDILEKTTKFIKRNHKNNLQANVLQGDLESLKAEIDLYIEAIE